VTFLTESEDTRILCGRVASTRESSSTRELGSILIKSSPISNEGDDDGTFIGEELTSFGEVDEVFEEVDGMGEVTEAVSEVLLTADFVTVDVFNVGVEDENVALAL
jgi:hypothetical protein